VRVRRALRTLTTFGELAVFLWRRYGSPAENGTAEAESPAPAPVAEPTQRVRFGLDGQQYEIDLSDDEAAELREAVGRYIAAGRRADRRTRARTSAPADPPAAQRPTMNGHDSAAVREWARANGHRISARGPIPATVRQAYDARGRRRGR
jgi:Lsr2